MPEEVRISFLLDEDEELHAQYDAEADIMELWRGAEPQPAVSHETPEGHLVRIAFGTNEICGFTIFDWHSAGWDKLPRIEFSVVRDDDDRPEASSSENHVLVPCG